jgi:high-affinity iron transporter
MYFGLLSIPTRYLFSVTSWLIAVLAAGMAAQAVAFLQVAGIATALPRTAWDTSDLLSDGSVLGKVLSTLIGTPISRHICSWSPTSQRSPRSSP